MLGSFRSYSNARLLKDLDSEVLIISSIEDEEVIKKILKHLGLWKVKARPPPKVKSPSPTIYLDDSESQILSPDSFYAHPDYPMDSYLS